MPKVHAQKLPLLGHQLYSRIGHSLQQKQPLVMVVEMMMIFVTVILLFKVIHFLLFNGVHPSKEGGLTGNYPKIIVKVDMSTAKLKSAGFAAVSKKWSFDATTIGHDVDMEGLTCGEDDCSKSIYVGDEYNYIYKLDLASGLVTHEWNLRLIVGNVNDDKGIESLTYDGKYFYAGIQETAVVHQVTLTEDISTAAGATSLTVGLISSVLGFVLVLSLLV